MGLMDKLRDMFTEEVEDVEEHEIKSEVIQVEIPAPQKREEQVAPVEEIKKEEKVSQPIFFDDNDFATLEPPKKQQQKVSRQPEKNRKKMEDNKNKKEEKKVFKPTPIISPVYGVLDKNYHKEDVKITNNSRDNAYYNHKDVSVDEVRKKAYGTLEDDLEITLFGEQNLEEKETEKKQSESLDTVDVETEEIDMFDELLDDQKQSEPLEVNDDISSDLFNLIDAMYEKEGDNNGDS